MRSRQIADFSYFNTRTLEDRLILRAKPNHRLVLAFGIDNSFTTINKHDHQKFLKKAHDAIRSTKDWIGMGSLIKPILVRYLTPFDGGGPRTIRLAPLVRVASFDLVLHIMFGVKPAEIDNNAVIKVTEAINLLWIRSKDADFTPSSADADLFKSLNESLEELVSSRFRQNDCARPLDLIMPAYETLWRVVLLTFVSVMNILGNKVESDEAEACHHMLHKVPKCLGLGNADEMRALTIAKEGLRLYPPTKRVYRATSTTEHDSDVLAADVEACQRNEQIWGPDALEFKPTRFRDWASESTVVSVSMEALGLMNSKELKRLSYFPFGVGRHECPAAGLFGERMITLLVAELAAFFIRYPGGLNLRFGNIKDLRKIPTPLPSDRSEMDDWFADVSETTCTLSN
ncbi:cytochrome P450 [Xylaria sp. CBS 124048]|nr:cytochrome P450 [Xylaria sp. CBS 124048]